MNIIGMLTKRASARLIREAENATVKKIKQKLFGEKEKKIIASDIVMYRRMEVKINDFINTHLYIGKELKSEQKKKIIALGENLDKLYKNISTAKKPNEHYELMKKIKLILK